jgi:hypothetical protein
MVANHTVANHDQVFFTHGHSSLLLAKLFFGTFY